MGYKLRINGIVEESIVDGPGLRYVVFTQGCPHGCPGCHNPETHDPGGGFFMDLDDMLAQIRDNPLLAGVTFSGGEPFLQAGVLSTLARAVRALSKTVITYTGFTFDELPARAPSPEDAAALLSLTDILVDGPYREEERDLELPFRGSRNQRILQLQDGALVRELPR
jgi:anaerobic ribonucleoside-triphosphate reductase activating protein